MKTLSTPIADAAAATTGAWVEFYDLYLGTTISTPWGEVDTLRLTPCPGGRAFFTPLIDPEPVGTQGDAATYHHWPIKRGTVTDSMRLENQRFTIVASNVTTDFAQILEAIDWEAVKVVVRKSKLDETGTLTAEDAVIVFTGRVDRPDFEEERQTISLQCSTGDGLNQETLPSENMHTSCRFDFGDDDCGMIPYSVANLSAKTVGSGSTETEIVYTGTSEDTGDADGSEGTDEVDALADAAITASSEASGVYLNEPITAGKLNLGRSPGINYLIIGSSVSLVIADGARIKFSGTTMPGGITAGTWYRARNAYGYVMVYPDGGGSSLVWSSNGTGVLLTTEEAVGPASSVRVSNTGFFWKFSTAADWGDASQGYWQIPDAQAGVANAALKPYIQFDFGSAKALKLWRIMTVGEFGREGMVRQLVIFSSTDSSSWKFERYFECPPEGDRYFECDIPGAQSARYWRICVRSRWSETLQFPLLKKVRAYTGGRNWWRNGWVRFDADTTTTALRNVVRPVRESYAGRLIVPGLPAAPASGDTFTVKRGCGGEWNDCCAKGNQRNFGGFHTMPFETVVR